MIDFSIFNRFGWGLAKGNSRPEHKGIAEISSRLFFCYLSLGYHIGTTIYIQQILAFLLVHFDVIPLASYTLAK